MFVIRPLDNVQVLTSMLHRFGVPVTVHERSDISDLLARLLLEFLSRNPEALQYIREVRIFPRSIFIMTVAGPLIYRAGREGTEVRLYGPTAEKLRRALDLLLYYVDTQLHSPVASPVLEDLYGILRALHSYVLPHSIVLCPRLVQLLAALGQLVMQNQDVAHIVEQSGALPLLHDALSNIDVTLLFSKLPSGVE